MAGKITDIVNEKVELVHPGFMEAVRTLGFTPGIESLGEGSEAMSNHPFTDITENGACPANIVRVEYASHMVMNYRPPDA